MPNNPAGAVVAAWAGVSANNGRTNPVVTTSAAMRFTRTLYMLCDRSSANADVKSPRFAYANRGRHRADRSGSAPYLDRNRANFATARCSDLSLPLPVGTYGCGTVSELHRLPLELDRVFSCCACTSDHTAVTSVNAGVTVACPRGCRPRCVVAWELGGVGSAARASSRRKPNRTHLHQECFATTSS